MFEHNNIKIKWLGHDSFLITAKGKNIYLDPYKIEDQELPKADIIITSHEHFDHCNPDSINSISNESTILIGPTSTKAQLEGIGKKKEVKEFNVGDLLEVHGIKVSNIPAYNIHRYRDPEKKQVFHPKEQGHIAPILNIDGTTIYHAGDTDKTPEMDGLKPTIALIPVSGTYVMDVPEAIEAALAIDAEITIPMHVGRGIGTLEMAKEFKEKMPEKRIEVLDM
ncbi:MAG: MBL fold metallo-hydrolase [Candidatus Heimdallarchaeota archaeon]|nr:MBL fold metallo-hydrolase [Candidatus Heimdallarchaeota archaeon]